MCAKTYIEPEITITFEDKDEDYMIIVYPENVSFQRCGDLGGSGETEYADVEERFNSELIDWICLVRDWDKVTSIGFESNEDL